MNISLLLIEISQNEKGLYKLTFIINKYNMCVSAHGWNLCSLLRPSPRCIQCMLFCHAAICYALFHQTIHLRGGMMFSYMRFYRSTGLDDTALCLYPIEGSQHL